MKTSIKGLDDNVAFYNASVEDLKGEPAEATAKTTQLGELADDMRAQVVDLQENLTKKDAVAKLIVHDLFATLATSLKSLTKNFRAGFNKSACDAFCIRFIDSELHADAIVDGITIHFWEVLLLKMMGHPLIAMTSSIQG